MLSQARYYLEHELLPELFFEDREEFINALLENEASLIYYYMQVICKENEIICPYTEEQYKYSIIKIDDTYSMIKIKFPDPEKKVLCSYVYFVYDAEFDDIRYFTVEKVDIPQKRKQKKVFYLCEWDVERNHYNYGPVPNGILEQENYVKKIILLS